MLFARSVEIPSSKRVELVIVTGVLPTEKFCAPTEKPEIRPSASILSPEEGWKALSSSTLSRVAWNTPTPVPEMQGPVQYTSTTVPFGQLAPVGAITAAATTLIGCPPRVNVEGCRADPASHHAADLIQAAIGHLRLVGLDSRGTNSAIRIAKAVDLDQCPGRPGHDGIEVCQIRKNGLIVDQNGLTMQNQALRVCSSRDRSRPSAHFDQRIYPLRRAVDAVVVYVADHLHDHAVLQLQQRVFGVSSMEMLAVVSSKRTPLTMVLPLVMTPVEMVLPPAPGGGVVVPVPPVPPPPPQATRMEAANAARSAVRR